MRDLGEPGAGVEDQAPTVTKVEHADDVVGRRWSPLLVTVVEAVELLAMPRPGRLITKKTKSSATSGCGRTPPRTISVTANAAISPRMSAQTAPAVRATPAAATRGPLLPRRRRSVA